MNFCTGNLPQLLFTKPYSLINLLLIILIASPMRSFAQQGAGTNSVILEMQRETMKKQALDRGVAFPSNIPANTNRTGFSNVAKWGLRSFRGWYSGTL
jgi:hypothetical protein